MIDISKRERDVCSVCHKEPPIYVDMTLDNTIFYCEKCYPIEKRQELITGKSSQDFMQDIEKQRRAKFDEYCLICGKKPIGYVVGIEYGNFGWCEEHKYLGEDMG